MNPSRRTTLAALAGVIAGATFPGALRGQAAAPAGAPADAANAGIPGIAPQAAAALEGDWLGSIALPQGGSAAIAMRVTRDAKDRLLPRFSVPDMHLLDAPFPPLEVLAANRFRLEPFGTTATLSGDRLAGGLAFTQLPFSMDRVAALPAWPDQRPADVPRGPRPRWTRRLGSGVWSSPQAHGGTLYVADTGGSLHALRMRDGRTRWRAAHDAALYGNLCVAGDALYFVDDRSRLAQCSRATGELQWQLPLDALRAATSAPRDVTHNHRTPVPVVAGGTLYIGASDGQVRAVDPASGAVVWQSDVRGAVVCGVAVCDDLLIAGTFDPGAIVALDRRNGRERWRLPLAQPVTSTPVLAGEIAVVGCRDFTLYGVQARTGAIAWRHSYLFSWVESTPRLVDGVLYVGASDLRSVRAVDPATGKTRWACDVYGLTWGTPAVARDFVYAGTAGQTGVLVAHEPGLCAIDRRRGTLAWRRAWPMGAATLAGIVASPVLAEGLLVTAAVDGTLTAFPA
jgi:outer membrane protein assembly factor BamB